MYHLKVGVLLLPVIKRRENVTKTKCKIIGGILTAVLSISTPLSVFAFEDVNSELIDDKIVTENNIP